MSGSFYDIALQNIGSILWLRKHMGPAPRECSDEELEILWADKFERYNLYMSIIDSAEKRRNEFDRQDQNVQDKDEWAWSQEPSTSLSVVFSNADMDRLYERADEMVSELEALDYEWSRRPWLPQTYE